MRKKAGSLEGKRVLICTPKVSHTEIAEPSKKESDHYQAALNDELLKLTNYSRSRTKHQKRDSDSSENETEGETVAQRVTTGVKTVPSSGRKPPFAKGRN